jgi:parallel beta-helix repeat protein
MQRANGNLIRQVSLAMLSTLGVLTSAGTASADSAIPVTACGTALDRPGHYVLTADLVCDSGSAGLLITANDVDLNFKGYTLKATASVDVGIVTATTGRDAISPNGVHCVAAQNAHIYNGKITGFRMGIFLCARDENGADMNATVERMQVTQNEIGMQLFQSGHNIIKDNNLSRNQHGDGLDVGCPENAPAGCGSGNVISGNVIDNNSFTGMFVSSGNNRITGNHISRSPNVGLFLFNNSNNEVEGNVLTANGAGLMVTGRDNRVSRNRVFNSRDKDISGDSEDCSQNRWESNQFGTSSASCIK